MGTVVLCVLDGDCVIVCGLEALSLKKDIELSSWPF